MGTFRNEMMILVFLQISQSFKFVFVGIHLVTRHSHESID